MPVSHRRAPRVARSPTVYTNAPNRRGEARSSHLCTLFGPPGPPATQQCTQTPQSDAWRLLPPICVHCCDPKATHSPSPQFNSVHKRPNPTPGGSYHPSVYTPAVPCSPRKPTGILVEHVFKLEDLVIVEAPSQMVTINGVGATADVTLGNNFSVLALGNHVPVFSDCSVRSAR